MGDLPLRTPTDRCLGGPLPRQQANRTHPHHCPPNLSSHFDASMWPHTVLIRLSTGYPVDRGRLDTRYSPVRRSPSDSASWIHDAPRLACVKPVASVHPEPGSNSTLYKYLYSIAWILSCSGRLSRIKSKENHYNFHWRFVYPIDLSIASCTTTSLLCKSFKELLSCRPLKSLTLESGCKGTAKFNTLQTFRQKT